MNANDGGSSERVATGIPGLDEVLRGGFLRGAVYIVQGAPGTGKTTLTNQLCYHQGRAGRRSLYVTLLAESHARLLVHLRSMAFFDEEQLPETIRYISAFPVLEQTGLHGVLELIRREVRARDAEILVLDGFVPPEEAAAVTEPATSTRDYKKFVHELQVHCNLSGCTAFLNSSGRGAPGTRPEHTMVDGIVELEDNLSGLRAERSLQICKFRGSGYLRGRHAFEISSAGMQVYPRIEAMLARPSRPDAASAERVSTGIAALDAMIGGGYPAGSTTMVFGPSGAGKTTLGLHFVRDATPAEPALIFDLYESPARTHAKARGMGLDLASLERTGALEVLWTPPVEVLLDALGHQLLDAVRRRSVRRLFVDGLGGFLEAATQRERILQYFTALANELRGLGVTTLYTLEARELLGANIEGPFRGLSTVIDNLIVLRFHEHGPHLQRLLSVLKVRDSGHDGTVRGFRLGAHGLELDDGPGDPRRRSP